MVKSGVVKIEVARFFESGIENHPKQALFQTLVLDAVSDVQEYGGLRCLLIVRENEDAPRLQ